MYEAHYETVMSSQPCPPAPPAVTISHLVKGDAPDISSDRTPKKVKADGNEPDAWRWIKHNPQKTCLTWARVILRSGLHLRRSF